jgi:hypothetical protein
MEGVGGLPKEGVFLTREQQRFLTRRNHGKIFSGSWSKIDSFFASLFGAIFRSFFRVAPTGSAFSENA